ncbi:MAG TPA: two-component regulator propeller domain-containing protein, partial [Chryseosolibacter sp.]|nr:two-component regulator propeller domain-containing protein [Chryseosolibacter sp.]
MKKNIFLIAIALVVVATCGTVFSQPVLEKFKFSRIDVNSGLSNSNITCFLHDSNGFLWIGTRDGLNKYDGYHFTVYRNDQEDSTTLLKNNIYQLYQDRKGLMWVSTRGGGFHYYDSLKDRFRRIEEFSSYCVVAHISEDNGGNLWVAGIRNGQAFAARLDRHTMKWTYHSIFQSVEPVTFLKQKSPDEFWLGVRRTGFYTWNVRSNQVEKYPVGDGPGRISPGFLKAVEDGENNLWIITAEGLTKFEKPTGRFTNYTIKNTDGQPALNLILDICSDGPFIWMGTENGGLIRFDSRSQTFRNFYNDKYDMTSLSDNSVWSVYKDKQDRIWIGTFSKGVALLDKMKDKFAELDIPLQNDVVNAIYKDSKGRMWIGTEGGLVMKDKKQIRYYKHDPRDPGSIGSNPILSICEDSDNTLWFGTWASGIARYDESRDRFINYNSQDDDVRTVASPNVFSIRQRSNKKELLVSSFRGFSVMVDRQKGVFERHVDVQHPANNIVSCVYEDSRGNIWIGSNAELNLYNIETRKRTRYYPGSLHDSTTIGGYINAMLEDSKGRLWIGASNGLHMLIDKKYVARYTTKQGLPNDIVRGILEDARGNLWLSTTQGLSQFDPEKGTFKNYDVSDGLLGNEFKPNSCFKDENGYMFFGGTGVVVFHPDSLKHNPHIPKV